MRQITTIAILYITAATSSLGAAEGIEPPWIPDGVVASVDIPVNGEPIQVSVCVNGVDRKFILDTGSATCVLSDTSRIGDKPGKYKLPERTIWEFTVLGIRCPWITSLTIVDMAHFQDFGIKTDGILGMDFLSRYVMYIDPDHGKLFLCDPKRFAEPRGVEVPLIRDEYDRPCVEVNLNRRQRTQFLIDTGNLSSMEANNIDFYHLRLLSRHTHTGVRIGSSDVFGNITFQEQIRIPGIDFGETSLPNVVIRGGHHNLIGWQQLARFRLTFDFPVNKSYWEPGARISYRDRGDHCGMSFGGQIDGELEIASVSQSSLAAAAGLRASDRIIEINGRETRSRTESQWSRFFSFPQLEPIKVRVKRGATDFALVIGEK